MTIVLKNDRSQILSIGSIKWSSEGGFLYTHRTELNRDRNELLPDKVEEFQPTNLAID